MIKERFKEVDMIRGCRTIAELDSKYLDDIIYADTYSDLEFDNIVNSAKARFPNREYDLYYFDKRYIALWSQPKVKQL